MTGETSRVRVAGESPYDLVVGSGVLGELPELVGENVRKVAVVHSRAVRAAATGVTCDLNGRGYEAYAVEVPDGEAAKDLAVAASVWARLGELRFTRSDAVVGLGGGAVTDLAGFVAATWLRGVRVVHVPTTLLAMVDAAVGGKTAINTEAGKNLVGAFHSPAGVVCDLTLLSTLPVNDYVSGLAEVVKAGFIADPRILELIEADPSAATDPGGPATRELVVRSVRVKAGIVSADPREHGRRAFLNYGHTLGHAIEKVEGYHWRHGDAVSVGMVFAAELARLTGRLDSATADRHRALLGSLGLPVSYSGESGDSWPRLLDAMAVDKKATGGRLRFVVLEGVGRPVLLEAPEPALMAAAFAEVAG